MKNLVWELFEMLREVLPATASNTRRLAKWAEDFHAEVDDPHDPVPETHPSGAVRHEERAHTTTIKPGRRR
jgi:hypothetical protein